MGSCGCHDMWVSPGLCKLGAVGGPEACAQSWAASVLEPLLLDAAAFIPLVLGVLLGRLALQWPGSTRGKGDLAQSRSAGWQICGREGTFSSAKLAHWLKGDVILPSQPVPWQLLKRVCWAREREWLSSIRRAASGPARCLLSQTS